MWGSGNQQANEMSPANATTSNTRSPCQTPKPSHSLSLFNNQTTIHPQQNPHHEKCNKSLETQNNSHHIKWNGNSSVNSKEVISIFPIHHNNEAFTQPTSTNTLHDSYHSNHHLHRNSSDITNCEVWPTAAYSQYQYFSYHHVPNAHHQHQASTQWVNFIIISLSTCFLIWFHCWAFYSFHQFIEIFFFSIFHNFQKNLAFCTIHFQVKLKMIRLWMISHTVSLNTDNKQSKRWAAVERSHINSYLFTDQ